MYKNFTRILSQLPRWIPKFLILMKLTFFLLLISLVHVNAASYGQKITLNKKEVALQYLLDEISRQSGYDIFYDANSLKGIAPLSVNFKNLDIEQAINKCVAHLPLAFSIENKAVVIRQKSNSVIDRVVSYLISININGIVTDEPGNPLPGATVVASYGNTRLVAITNAKGEFTLKGVNEKALITISCVGFNSKQISAAANIGKIVLEPAVSKLDEVSVQAYGQTSKRFSTGNISTVKSEEIAKQPISNPILALAGRTSGVYIRESNGTPGSNFDIVIQGQNTIQAGKLPLYIIDGIPFGGKPIENTVGVVSAGESGFSPLNTLSPNDIDNISVLKDADATAIYGSRAANGVVLITTKKGVKGKTTINAELYGGINKVGRTIPMLNAEQYLSMRTQGFTYDKITPTALNAPDLTVFNTGGNIDMQKLLAGNTGHFTNANLSVSGGEQNTQFLLSGNFRKESSVVSNDFSDLKVQGRFNVQHQSNNRRFKANANISVAKERNEPATLLLGSVYNLPPNLPVYNADGSLAWETGYTNPLAGLKNINKYDSFNLLSNLGFSYEVTKGLNFKTDVAFNHINVNSISATTRASKNPASSTAGIGNSTLTNTANELYQVEPQLNYNTVIGKGKLEALIGGTYQYTHNVQPVFATGTFVNDALYNDLGSLNITLKGSGEAETKYASFFGRVNYNWDKKYILNASYRIDGSSKFPPGYRYGKFGSIGAAWIFSEEDFIKKELSWLSFGKLRSSYGSIGNDQIADNGYVAPYVSSGVAYGGVSGLYVSRLANLANYSWELTKKFNLSLDLGFFKDQVLLTGSFFRNETQDLLMSSVPIASQSGFTGYTGNLAGIKVENKGLELELSTINLNKKGFSWRTSFNFTAPKNRLRSYPELENSAYASGASGTGMVIGKSLNLLSGYIFTGFENGLPTVKDVNGDGKITAGLSENNRGDFVALGTSDPKFYGGLNNSLSYKGFQLDFLFQFVKKTAPNIYRDLVSAPGNNSNFPTSIYDYPFIYSSQSSSDASKAYLSLFRLSSAGFSDASFVRLKNVSLTYNLSEKILKPVNVQRANVYLRAQNLFTITKYNGLDPETTGVGMPLLKLVTIGLQASF